MFIKKYHRYNLNEINVNLMQISESNKSQLSTFFVVVILVIIART